MDEIQHQSIRLLLVEDVAADAERAVRQFKRAGVSCDVRRVETAEALSTALRQFSPTLILSDFTLPRFDGMSALQICRTQAPAVPFMFLSGTIGEERAVAAMQAGASDYVLKENMTRLVPAAQRAISHAQAMVERSRQEAQLLQLNRVLRLLKSVNEVVMRGRDRGELLAETCRLAVSLGGYAAAVAATRSSSTAAIKAVASNGIDEEMTTRLGTYVEESSGRESSALGSVFRTGREFVCNDTTGGEGTARFDALMMLTGLRSVVALPLIVDGETCAMLLLTSRSSGVLSAEEMDMLRELAHSLSFGLRYLLRDTRARFLSHFHPQTGLASRSLFCDRVRDLIGSAPRGTPCAVVAIDVRRLSTINDSFGRHTADLLLRKIADGLKRRYPQQEQLAHFGGGNFALLLKQSAQSGTGPRSRIPGEVDELFGKPFRVDGRSIPVAVRVGCALYPEDADDAMTLVQRAETALQATHLTGQASFRFDPAVQSRSVSQLALEHRLRLALEQEEFELHYQPKVDVVTRRIQGAEALIRWRSPDDGLVSPDVFLPVLESSGLILQVGDWVISRAVADCLAWKAAGLPPVRVAVNISPAQLRQPEFEGQILQATRPWASRDGGIDIEITEGVLQEDCEAEISKLQRLRAAGMRIAIDDFGTGYSSLSRLSTLPIDTLKIDRRFITQIVHNPIGARVVKTVVALAHTFNMTSVAEGVETQEQLDQLWHMRCNQSQGYLHCVPLPAEQFAVVLKNGRGALVQPPASGDEEDQQDQG